MMLILKPNDITNRKQSGGWHVEVGYAKDTEEAMNDNIR